MILSSGIEWGAFLLAMVAAGAALRWRGRRAPVASAHWRGRTLRSTAEATQLLDAARSPTDPGLSLGSLRLPSRAACSHFAIAGATGSGKTLLQRLLMQSALSRIGQGDSHRALLYDAKQDLLPLLAGMDLRAPIHTLHPLDRRAVAWNMAADIKTPAAALQTASLLIPEIKTDNNPFFANAARHLLTGAINALIEQAGAHWTLLHVLLVMRDPVRLGNLLGRSDHTRFLLQYFEHTGTFQNILSTVLTALAPFDTLAAAWDRAEKSISLARWMTEESILVLGCDEANRVALEAMNRLIFRRISELVLSRPEVTDPDGYGSRTWFFLDEVREAGKLESLSRLLTKGRSKGAAVVLGFQDIAGLQDVYGKEVANELVGQCATSVMLRLNSPETAAWASKLIGSREVLETRHGHSRSYHSALQTLPGTGSSVSHGLATRPLVLDSEIMGLPPTSFDTGLSAYVVTPWTGAFHEHLSGDWLRQNLRPPEARVPNFLPSPAPHQYLRPWGPEDEAILRFAESRIAVWN